MPVGTFASAASKTGLGGTCTDVLSEPFDNLGSWTNTSCTIASGRTGTAASIPASGNVVYTIPAINESSTVTVGFAFRCNTLAAADSPICEFLSDTAATIHSRLTVDNGGAVHFYYRGTSTEITGSAFNTVLVDTWYYIEVQVRLSDTVGAFTVKLNGTTLLSGSGLDTKNAGTKTTYDAIRLRSAATATWLFDDLYLSTGTACAFKGSQTLAVCRSTITLEPFNNFTDNGWTAGNASIDASGRNGTCVLLPSGSGSCIKHLVESQKADTMTIGFAFRTDTVGIQAPLIEFRSDSASTRHATLTIESTNGLKWWRGVISGGTGLLTSATGLIAANTWYYLEIQWKLHDSTGTVDVRLNGVSVMSGTALDTKNAGTVGFIESVYLYNVTGPSPNTRYDDLYLSTGSTCAFRDDPAPTRPRLVGTPSIFPAANTASTTLTIAIPTPTGAEVGEGLLALMTSSAQTATDITPPAGWARIGLGPINDGGVRILGFFFHKLVATPASSYSFTSPAAGRFGGVIWRVRYINATQPHKAANAYGNRVTATVPTIAFNVANSNQPTGPGLYLVMTGSNILTGSTSAVTSGPSGMVDVGNAAEFGLVSGTRSCIRLWQADSSSGDVAASSVVFPAAPSSAANNGIILQT